MTSVESARLLALGLLLVVGLGCVGAGFDLEDLSDEPLAFVYRNRDESERRVEILERAREPSRTRVRAGNYDANYMRVEDGLEALGFGQTREEKAATLLGRMAGIAARTESVTTFDFALGGDRPFDWSADRQRLLFRSLRGHEIQLFEWNRETGNVRAMTSSPGSHRSGCYGPDGRLAYSKHVPTVDGSGHVSRIWVTESGGGLPRALSPGPSDAMPVWSPDGKLIVYQTVGRGGREALVVIDVDTEGDPEPRPLAFGRDPTFSPDGQWIVYSARTRDGWKLFQVHPNGLGKRALGSSAREEHDPAVSPDGRFVAYVADDDDRQKLRVRSFDGTGDRPLLVDGDGASPVW
ncbi:MAG: TolB family protein [Myxococcota bacterium]